MSATALLFRIRLAFLVLLHLIGFLLPWNYLGGGSRGTLWLAASTLAAHTGWLNLASATLTITILGIACLVTGTALRVWGTAYLGSRIMRETSLQGQRLVAAGPYAYLRNPLYLGTWFIGLATSLLMPLDGSAFFLATFTGFLLFLIAAEERFLAIQMGQSYLVYRRDVPRLWPRFAGRLTSSPAQPHWLHALLHETYPIGLTLCFAILAWRYNAQLLIRCLLICYGFSLVMRAMTGTAKDTERT